MLMLPEIIVLSLAFLVIFYDLFVEGPNSAKGIARITWTGLFVAALALIFTPHEAELFGGRFAVDEVTWWFKLVFILSSFVTVGLSYNWIAGTTQSEESRLSSPGEFCALLLFTLSGMLYMASSRDLISAYVSLELATIPLFLLSAWNKNCPFSKEAGAKYLVSGAMASAFLLYGLGLLYGLTGEMSFSGIAENLTSSPALYSSVVLIMAGIGFKMTLVPFHMWAADVYQGSPTPVTAFLSTASKAAGVTMFFHMFMRVFVHQIPDLGWLLAIGAFVTMTLGNLVAIVQSNMKRFLAFSGISQAGYILMGFLSGPERATDTVAFYLLVYLVSNLCVFGVALYYSALTGKEDIKEYNGLSRTHPGLALIMLVGLFSLAGIPPLSGFLGKFFLCAVAAEQGYYWLVAAAAVNSTVSLYYYLKIIRQMYIEKPDESPILSTLSFPVRVGLALSVIGTILLGIIPIS